MAIDRKATLEILRRLSRTPLGEHLILGGSSGLYAVSEKIPALTEDVDFLVDADWVAAHEEGILAEMKKAGFRHYAGTCTLVAESGESLDLVGYSRDDADDRIGGGEKLRVMVFADLSTLLSSGNSVTEVATGGLALSAAALTVAKLMTVRQEKGSKDKLQALALIDERSDDGDFLAAVRRFLDEFEPDRVEDALADAKMAVMTISVDVERADPQARGYAEMQDVVERGLETLQRMVESP